MAQQTFYSVAPSAARLTESLRDIGYDFPTAVADIVDNSIAAGASRVDVEIVFDGPQSWVSITDDGMGMTANGLLEALRYGSRRNYGRYDLGRYGLGLKTASLSQCRSVTVVTCGKGPQGRKTARMIDLDIVAEWDDWLVVDPPADSHIARAKSALSDSSGTVILWRKLDRILPENRPAGGWARRRLDALSEKTSQHLGMVFHRFLEGDVGTCLVLTVNGKKVKPWNPFARDEPTRQVLPPQRFEVSIGECTGAVMLRRYVLPARDQFSSPVEFERLSGPLNWNRQQGLYVYRAQRLVQWGGWNGVRGIDEHTKLARAALDFDADLDLAFNINVAKMRVSIPPQLRQILERPIHELCLRADEAYRKTSRRVDSTTPDQMSGRHDERLGRPDKRGASSLGHIVSGPGLALRAAAMQAGEYAAWQHIVEVLRVNAPDVVASLGLDD